jgi:hypothetical protein
MDEAIFDFDTLPETPASEGQGDRIKTEPRVWSPSALTARSLTVPYDALPSSLSAAADTEFYFPSTSSSSTALPGTPQLSTQPMVAFDEPSCGDTHKALRSLPVEHILSTPHSISPSELSSGFKSLLPFNQDSYHTSSPTIVGSDSTPVECKHNAAVSLPETRMSSSFDDYAGYHSAPAMLPSGEGGIELLNGISEGGWDNGFGDIACAPAMPPCSSSSPVAGEAEAASTMARFLNAEMFDELIAAA